MERQKEQLLAAALWAFIERLRREQDHLAAGLDGLVPADAEELAALFRTAEGLNLALADSGESLSNRATERLDAAIAARAERRTGQQARGFIRFQSTVQSWLRPAGWWSIGLAAAALVIGVLMGQRLPSADPLRHPPAAIQALSHMEARERIPLLMAGKLSPREARAVLWHLAHCDRCFEAYERMHSTAGKAPSVQVALVSSGLAGQTSGGRPPVEGGMRAGVVTVTPATP